MNNENLVARQIVDAAFQVHQKLGPGLLESIYERILAYELERRSITVQRQVPLPVVYDGLRFEEGFRVDLMVADSVIVELKSVERVLPVHKKQLLSYLRLADKRLGLLINFGAGYFKNAVCRIANGMPDDRGNA